MLNDDAIVSETDVDIFVVDPIVTSALDGISVGFDTDNLGSEANESGESSENHDDSACCTCFRFR